MNIIFNDESYIKFLNEKKTVYNSRLRPDDESFFDAMMSKEADLSSTPEGEKVISYIQALRSE